MADLLFSKGFLQQLGLHAHLGEHLLQPAVPFAGKTIPRIVFWPGSNLKRLHLADHRRVHASILRPPLVERRVPSRRCKNITCRATASSHVRGTALPPARRLRPDAGSKGSGVPCICSSSFEISSCILPRKFYLSSPLVSGGVPPRPWPMPAQRSPPGAQITTSNAHILASAGKPRPNLPKPSHRNGACRCTTRQASRQPPLHNPPQWAKLKPGVSLKLDRTWGQRHWRTGGAGVDGADPDLRQAGLYRQR